MRGNASFNLFAALGLTAACLFPHQAAAIVVTGVTIDEFVTQMNVSVDAAATTSPPYAPSNYGYNIDVPDAIGGQRGLYVEKTYGINDERVRARINPPDPDYPEGLELLSVTLDVARGLVQVIWDGDAANQAINFNGLLGMNLAEDSNGGRLLDPFFQIEVTSSDHAGPATLFIYQNGGGGGVYASGTLTLPGNVTEDGASVVVDKTFDSFLLSDGVTECNQDKDAEKACNDIFTNVGAIVMEINATAQAQQGWDMSIGLLTTRGTAVPVPATLLLLGTGWLGLRFARRTRYRQAMPLHGDAVGGTKFRLY